MKEEKAKSKKKVWYYILLAVSVLLLAAATVLTVYFATAGDVMEGPGLGDTGNAPVQPTQPTQPDQDKKPTQPDQGEKPSGTDVPSTPASGETVYVLPLENGAFAVQHDSLYANAVTGSYYRHQGVDFTCSAGEEVYAVADGTVLTVSMSEELGNLITVDHGDGLVSLYRFVEPVSGIKAGDRVKAGDTIATVAEAYGSEGGNGVHLHFEMTSHGVQEDPADYLDPILGEK